MKILMRFPEGRAKTFTLSYDDGVTADIRLIEIMKKNGIKGTFNINSDRWLRHENDGDVSFKNAKEIYLDNGMEIATHAVTHPHLTQMPAGCVAYEIVQDRITIESRLGIIVRGHAYPYGNYNKDVMKTLKECGIVYARTTVSTGNFNLPQDGDEWLALPATAKHTDPKLFELGEKFLGARTDYRPFMFYLWGHSYEFDEKHDNNWELIEKFLELMGGHDDIWYATNIEIYDYIDAYKRLQFSAKGDTVYNPSAIRIWFSINHEVVSVGAGETLKLF